MEASFWHERWRNSETAFHLNRVNPVLKKHFDKLALNTSDRIFVPLCGASNDLPWLVEQGLEVVGVELSELAVEQLFNENSMSPTKTEHGGMTLWQADRLSVYQGDIFALTTEMIGPISGVYDRAALIALPEPMRLQYIAHLNAITPMSRRTLLITIEYDATVMSGPPFSVNESAVSDYFVADFNVEQLSSRDILDESPRFREKGHKWMREPVYMISPL